MALSMSLSNWAVVRLSGDANATDAQKSTGDSNSIAIVFFTSKSSALYLKRLLLPDTYNGNASGDEQSTGYGKHTHLGANASQNETTAQGSDDLWQTDGTVEEA